MLSVDSFLDFDYEFLLVLPLYSFSVQCSLVAKRVSSRTDGDGGDVWHELRSQPSMEEIKDALKKGERSCLDKGKWKV